MNNQSGREDGKFFWRYEKALSEHATIYFGILNSDCKTVIEEENARVLIIQDGQLGTNDCRGWISQCLFEKLNLPEHRLYQFRLGIDRIQAKGCFKVMTDEVAQAVGVDVIVPRSSTKPKIDHVHFLQGPMILGIKGILH